MALADDMGHGRTIERISPRSQSPCIGAAGYQVLHDGRGALLGQAPVKLLVVGVTLNLELDLWAPRQQVDYPVRDGEAVTADGRRVLGEVRNFDLATCNRHE